MKTKNLDDLMMYVFKRYPSPKKWWSKEHFDKRCTEIYAAEQVLVRCMDNPFEELRDIILDYEMELAHAKVWAKSVKVVLKFDIMIDTLETLYNYLG